MSVFLYDPKFYDLDRIVDSIFSDPRRSAAIPGERKVDNLNPNAVRSLKPRLAQWLIFRIYFLTIH